MSTRQKTRGSMSYDELKKKAARSTKLTARKITHQVEHFDELLGVVRDLRRFFAALEDAEFDKFMRLIRKQPADAFCLWPAHYSTVLRHVEEVERGE